MVIPGSSSFSDQESEAWVGFLAVHAAVTRELDARVGAEHAMPLVEYEVLLKLSQAGGRLRMSDLADVAFLSRSGLTRIVDELEQVGHVCREPDDLDRRVLLATLTPLGRRRLAAAQRSHRAHVRELFLDQISPDQQRALAASWKAILDSIDRQTVRSPRRRTQIRSRGR
jgi:DNA-binding MarR family transcriptional regulator